MRWVAGVHGEVALRLALAALIGAAVGVERELREQAAGLRTHILVSVGACLFALVSAFGFEGLVRGEPSSLVRYDVSRVASNIVTGVGFLGAGAIIRHGLSVRGLTTAASLWVVAALGMAVALGMYWATGVAAVITIATLWGLRRLRGRIRRVAVAGRETLVLRVASEPALDEALEVLRAHGYRVRHLRLEPGPDGIDGNLELSKPPGAQPEAVAVQLTRTPGVLEVDWEVA